MGQGLRRRPLSEDESEAGIMLNHIEEQIKATLDKIRPFIQRDGGDVEFLTYEDGIVYIKMLGACANCVAQDETVSSGIEMILVDEVPGVLHVKVVSE